MEEKKFNPIKFLGMMAAFFLIIFGSFNNARRTVKIFVDKIKKK
ncbi:MAG TPA: hypothetical protein PKI92_02535 [Candidatus Woesebacteria bacterium]|nr:hypothetical protein [Candidatus Woesebacteria bacterium]HOY61409.1 hypothetical protein [Candidatus Woesebacteria bacterium]HPR99896.1 hypothetical protein [Candidatus Woesebacteria bacterium]